MAEVLPRPVGIARPAGHPEVTTALASSLCRGSGENPRTAWKNSSNVGTSAIVRAPLVVGDHEAEAELPTAADGHRGRLDRLVEGDRQVGEGCRVAPTQV